MTNPEVTSPPVASRPATQALRELSEASNAFAERLRRELAVNPTDLAAMEQLIEHGPSSPGELARALGISRPAVTAVVDRLTALGHASRADHPTDRRGVVVTAAPQSIARAMGMLFPMIADVDAALDGFSEHEQQVIAEYLRRVVVAYRGHASLPEGPDVPLSDG